MECDPGELTEPALEYAVSLPLPGDERERWMERWRSRCLHRRSCHSTVGGGNTILLSAEKNFRCFHMPHKEHEGYTHLRLKRTRVLLVIVAGPTENFLWESFRHVYETPDRRGPMP